MTRWLRCNCNIYYPVQLIPCYYCQIDKSLKPLWMSGTSSRPTSCLRGDISRNSLSDFCFSSSEQLTKPRYDSWTTSLLGLSSLNCCLCHYVSCESMLSSSGGVIVNSSILPSFRAVQVHACNPHAFRFHDPNLLIADEVFRRRKRKFSATALSSNESDHAVPIITDASKCRLSCLPKSGPAGVTFSSSVSRSSFQWSTVLVRVKSSVCLCMDARARVWKLLLNRWSSLVHCCGWYSCYGRYEYLSDRHIWCLWSTTFRFLIALQPPRLWLN